MPFPNPFVIAAVSVGLVACATPSSLPDQAPPFTADRPIHFPDSPKGHLTVVGFARKGDVNPPAAPGPSMRAWRLYDGDGHALTPPSRERGELDLPSGSYVLMTRDTTGVQRTAQVVVRSGQTTSAILPEISVPVASAVSDVILED